MIEPEKQWRHYLGEGRFMLQRSRSNGAYIFYPRVIAPETGASDLEWVEASGDGTVHAVTIIRKKDPADNYNVVLVDLAEGPRLMSRVDDIAPDDVRIGMAVTVKIVEEEGGPVLAFVPA